MRVILGQTADRDGAGHSCCFPFFTISLVVTAGQEELTIWRTPRWSES